MNPPPCIFCSHPATLAVRSQRTIARPICESDAYLLAILAEGLAFLVLSEIEPVNTVLAVEDFLAAVTS